MDKEIYQVAFLLLSAIIVLSIFASPEIVVAFARRRCPAFGNLGGSFSLFLGAVSIAGFLSIGFHLSFTFFILLACATAALLFFVLAMLVKKNYHLSGFSLESFSSEKTDSDHEDSRTNKNDKIVFYSAVTAAAIAVTLLNTSDADDAMYISGALRMIDSNALHIYDPSFDCESVRVHPAWRYLVWELIGAALSKLQGVHPVVLFHSVLPPILLIVSMAAYLKLAQTIFGDDYAYWGALAVLCFYIFFLGSHWSHGCFLWTRLWQGKAVFLHILYPVLCLSLISFLRAGGIQDYLTVFLSLVACTAVSATAIYLSLTATVLITISFLFFADMKTMSSRVILILPCMLIPSVILIDITQGVLAHYEVPAIMNVIASQTWKEIFQGFRGNDFVISILPLVVVAVAFFEKRNVARRFLFTYPVLLVATVLNPISGDFIIRELKVSGNYFRFFWLFPCSLLFAWGVLFVADRLRALGWIKIPRTLCYVIVILLVIGTLIPTNGFNVRCGGISGKSLLGANVFRLDPEYLPVLEYIEQRTKESRASVLATESISWVIPIYCKNVCLVSARTSYIDYQFGQRGREDQFGIRKRLSNAVNNLGCHRTLEADIRKLEVALVVIPSDQPDIASCFLDLGFVKTFECRPFLVLERSAVGESSSCPEK